MTPPGTEEARSLLLRGARLVGGDGSPTDVLVESGEVSSIARGITPGRGAEVVELDGRWLAPGLWDSHVHMDQWALARRRLDLSGAASAAQAASLVGERLRVDPPAAGETLVGYGFQDALWPDAPTRGVLDPVSGDVPVVLVSNDLHAAWLDSAALARYGHAGHETGLLREQAAFDASVRVSAVDDDLLDGWVADAAAAAASRGVVGVVDLEMSYSLDRWVRRVEGGARSLRIAAGVYPADLHRVVDRGLRTGDPIEGTDGLVTMGPFKIITDGSLNTRTAWCHDPYPAVGGEPAHRGVAAYTTRELVDWLRRASSAGLVPAVHAIGDAANAMALDAFEEVGCGGGIEHAQLVDAADVERFSRLGVVASMQPEHAMDDRDVADLLWAGRTDRAFALETLLAAGVALRLGSDAPVAPLDPWVTMAAAVSRSRDGRDPWHPEQRIVASAALAASTGGRSAVTTGSVADLVVVEADPLSVDDETMRSMPVSATLLGGRLTHGTLD